MLSGNQGERFCLAGADQGEGFCLAGADQGERFCLAGADQGERFCLAGAGPLGAGRPRPMPVGVGGGGSPAQVGSAGIGGLLDEEAASDDGGAGHAADAHKGVRGGAAGEEVIGNCETGTHQTPRVVA